MQYQIIFVNPHSFFLTLCSGLNRAKLFKPGEKSCQDSVKGRKPRFLLSVSTIYTYFLSTNQGIET
jgi:hypothetical protein